MITGEIELKSIISKTGIPIAGYADYFAFEKT